MFGDYTAGRLAKIQAVPLNRIAEGDRSIRLQTATAIFTFTRGDIVAISSSSTFRIGRDKDSYEVPTTLEVNRVERVLSGGLGLELRYPLRSTLDSAVVRKLGQSMESPADRRDETAAWATFGARLIGGTWEASPGMPIPFSAAGGALDCTVAPHSVVAYTGVGYGNLYARCTMDAQVQHISGVATELAFGSHDNTVTVHQLYMEPRPGLAKQVPWFVGVNEGARRNSISIRYMEVDDAGFDVVRLDRGSDNRVMIGNLSGRRIGGFVVRINSSGFFGTPPETTGNTVSIGRSEIDSQRGYVANAAGLTNTVAGDFSGSVAGRTD